MFDYLYFLCNAENQFQLVKPERSRSHGFSSSFLTEPSDVVFYLPPCHDASMCLAACLIEQVWINRLNVYSNNENNNTGNENSDVYRSLKHPLAAFSSALFKTSDEDLLFFGTIRVVLGCCFLFFVFGASVLPWRRVTWTNCLTARGEKI